MRWKPCSILALAFLSMAQGSIAQDYEEGFENGPQGWEGTGSSLVFSGGVDDGAWLRGIRVHQYATFTSAQPPSSDPAPGALKGDLRARYGNLIAIRYFARTTQTDGIGGPAYHQLGGGDVGQGTYWRLLIPESPEWSEVVIDIDTDWTDTEAEAAGWSRYGNDTGAPWASMFHNLFDHNFYAGDCPFPCESDAFHHTGIDEVRISGSGLAAGRIANLRIDKSGTDLVLSWEPDCGQGDSYGIYRGGLSAGLSSLGGIRCGLMSTTALLEQFPLPNDYIYLVVPNRAGVDGSFGVGSDGVERVQLTPAVCGPRGEPATCEASP